jgi:N6-L-threonylcarbamoyladenine synthase
MGTLILGIETSCDETAAAVVEDGQIIRSNVVASQIDLHRRYGGVFPEIASRQHILAIISVIAEAMAQAGVAWSDLTAVAVTHGPGLAGSLLVGVNAAKGIALAHNLPLLGINHLEGHLYSNWLIVEGKPPKAPGISRRLFPVLCLIVSGGHTELVLVQGHGRYRVLGRTLDDAAGEAFDKVARILGLEYPGGPAIQEAAKTGSPIAFKFPRAWLPDTYNFSFSGLKTAVLRVVRYCEGKAATPPGRGARSVGVISQASLMGQLPVPNLAASFQAAVVDVLVEKTRKAAEEFQVKNVFIAGGVAANVLLRQEMAARISLPVRCAPLPLCGDNGAMIAAAAHWRFKAGYRSGWDLDVLPGLRLEETGADLKHSVELNRAR